MALKIKLLWTDQQIKKKDEMKVIAIAKVIIFENWKVNFIHFFFFFLEVKQDFNSSILFLIIKKINLN